MAESIYSGYKEAAQTALSTQLNGLADKTWSALSAPIDNSATLYQLMDIELNLSSANFIGVDSAVEVYLVPSLDGTNYPTYVESGAADEQENNQYYVGTFTLSGAPGAQRHVLRYVACTPGVFKIGIRNQGNVALAATGNTVTYRRYGYASAP